ncbi:hypothetical protein EUU23_07950 [Sphingorhabdus sp. IMCC26285]|uniref:DUF262 domain-containing protein n=1 Tax=Sphingorhabdus profundilacus TaxID=2509718 RepID=A0A6I4LVS2_9SPHN|nr:hypothetical protein [Sphingorhabdus profundilacus]MVZ97637.1 hypothetical protein [Sphingorhabdus profundilacus]
MLECTSVDFDHRIGCFAVNCRADYRWYLENTQGSEDLLSIQRKIITGRKTYQTLRADLTRGCLLPPIVLAVSGIEVPEEMKSHPENAIFSLSDEKKDELAAAIVARSNAGIRIVDGLQRTNALRDVCGTLSGKDLDDFLSRPVRLEFWINISFYALAYRMLLLNAGQKPMSMKHQLEIVAENMQTELQTINGLEVITSMDSRRRSVPGQFQLSALAGAFQAWLQRQPHIDLRNAVTEQLLADEAIEALGRGMSLDGNKQGEEFTEFVKWLVVLDSKLGTANLVFLGNETVLLGMAAAVSSGFYSESLKDRTQAAMVKLIADIDAKGLDEGLGPNLFSDMRNGFDVKKINVGKATRDFVNYAFSEYFRNEGEKTMPECWIQASAQVSS